MQYLGDLGKCGTGLGRGHLAIGAAPRNQRCMPTLAMRKEARERAKEEMAKGMISKSGQRSTKGENTFGFEHGEPILTVPYIPFFFPLPGVNKVDAGEPTALAAARLNDDGDSCMQVPPMKVRRTCADSKGCSSLFVTNATPDS
jgi:hypothetical protein